jgi:hypothetical protein
VLFSKLISNEYQLINIEYISMKQYFIAIVLLIILPVGKIEAQRFSLNGNIYDNKTHQPIDIASVYISETYQGTNTDKDGYFEIKNLTPASYHLHIAYLGYEAADTLVKLTQNLQLVIFLEKSSLQLKEINVMAREKKQSSTTSVISLTAIEHLQPSSISDVLQLLPGGLLADPKLNETNSASARQAGSDGNTALGTAVVQDGVPVSNDYNMQSFYGSSSSETGENKSSVNKGVDLRQISTDHIGEVEVIRGIPSVKYGDLTSGAIIIKSKKGETPFTIRVKSDPLDKLFYVGKGFKLPGNLGTLNVGVDFTRYVADQRSPFDKYQRITSNLNHEIRIKKSVLISTQLAFIGTLDKQISDPDIMNEEDSYKSDYKSFKFSNTGTWYVDKNVLQKLEYTFSVNYAHDVLRRTKTVTLNSPMGISLSNTEGENEGFYLPSEYLATYKIDGKPFNLYADLSAHFNLSSGTIRNNVLAGSEFRVDKNSGEGSIYDLTRPPYPSSSSSTRPRAPKDIPSMEKFTGYAEDRISAFLGKSKLAVTAGIRASLPGNLVSDYVMHNKIYVEPRANFNLLLPETGTLNLKIELKGGIGDQLKFPTAMQLYPDKAYYDISELNFYSTNADNRLVYLLTIIKDRVNYNIEPARNRKYEAGFSIDYKLFSFDITLFEENEKNGFEEQSLYFPQVYKLYNTDSYSGSGTPEISDFTYGLKSMFLAYSYTTNASVINKKGIEYQISTKKIKHLNTEIIINGAWFHTTYDISQPRYKYPNIVTNGDYYPYVGVFNAGNDSKVKEQFNTTLFLNTHIPKLRLMFSTTIESVWYTSYQMIKYSGIPDYYIDLNGEMHPFTETEKESSSFKSLIETFSDAYFDVEKTPVSLSVNLKVTKEIGEHLKLSYFVNRILDYNPKYTTRFGVSAQKWVTPFMGAEMLIKI